MHRYLRSIGFRQLQNQPQVWRLLSKIQKQPDYAETVQVDEDSSQETMHKEFAPGMGIAVSGLRYKGRFHREYYYPYIRTNKVTTFSPCTISKQGEKEAYVGLCDDPHFGSSIIFYINNATEIIAKKASLDVPLDNKGIFLSGLASNGKILLPLKKTLSERIAGQIYAENHAQMVEEARNGDENSCYALAEEDYHLYEAVSRYILTEDIYSMVDSFFIPTGVECDQYTVMGDITSIRRETNSITGENIYVFDIMCNQVNFTIGINESNLLGEPKVGRRFKGDIWLQGSLRLEQ